MGSSINSVLHDLELLERSSSVIRKPVFRVLIRRLRNIRTFLLCATKLTKHAGLGSLLMRSLKCLRISGSESPKSLLMRVEDNIARFALEIHPYCLSGLPSNLVDMPGDFQDEMELFDQEIDEWYVSFREHFLLSTSPPEADEVLEITDSVLDNLEDILCLYNEGMLSPELMQDLRVELVQDLRERIKVLKNITRFAAMLRAGHLQLLTHVQEVSVVASHILHRCQFSTSEGLLLMSSDLLKLGYPIHSLEFETYFKIVRSSRLSRELRAPSVKVDNDQRVLVNEEFLESLVFVLWVMLQMDTWDVVSFKDQLQVLYEGLRFLRIAFKEQRHKFDRKTVNLTQVVLCEAGAIIFSLNQKEVEIDSVALSLVLGKIKLIKTEFEDQGSTFNFPKTNELGFVNSLIENLMTFTINGDDSNVCSTNVRKIHEQLVFVKSFLEDIDDFRSKQKELQSLWDRAVLVAYRMEFLIDHFVFGVILESCQTMSFGSIKEEMLAIENKALEILDGKRQEMKIKKVSRRSSRMPSQKRSIIATEVVGFIEEATAIRDQVTRGSKNLRIVAIVGMAGLGKTTLATKVYNDSIVVHHFRVCAWCSVSQVFNRKKVLLELLNHIMPDTYDGMTEEDLAEKLRRHLKGRRYLIFLDDVWDIEVWNSLEVVLPDDSNGSRILLTSRLQSVAPRYKLNEKPHFLRHLTADESWELMKRKVFNEEDCSPALFELGMQISETCEGLPLTIIIVAGLLAVTEPECWGEVLESLSSGRILSSTEQCMNTIELSYKNLPDYLKSCFLYFAAFPEDQEVSVKRLIQLWVAEGFVQKTEFKSMEDVAEDYLVDLIGRSLVMVAKERSIGGIKACRIHDLLHEFCLMKVKEEHFFLLLRGYDELLAFNEPCYLRRLCIHSVPEHLNGSRLFCPRVRTLLHFSEGKIKDRSHFNVSFVIRIFKLLRVLDLEQANLGRVFPSEMELLAQLKYLAVRGDEMEVIPSCFGNLSNLETFVVNARGTFISLPDTVWNMSKLRHLKTSKGTWFILPTKDLEKASILLELSSLSGAVLSVSVMERQLRKIPNIRKLKCKLHMDLEGDSYQIKFDVLTQLESLDISSNLRDHVELGFPVDLKKLTMSANGRPWSEIYVIGALPNLEVLNLIMGPLSGDVWEMGEGEFPKLRILKLTRAQLDRWTGSDEQLACLEKLVLHECWIKEMPSCLEYVSTLDMIKVSQWSATTRMLVEQIEETHKSMGNSTLKVIFE